ncbi:hypothetical protein CBL_08660 [Carabus blaptoides fortunei]
MFFQMRGERVALADNVLNVVYLQDITRLTVSTAPLEKRIKQDNWQNVKPCLQAHFTYTSKLKQFHKPQTDMSLSGVLVVGTGTALEVEEYCRKIGISVRRPLRDTAH